MHGLNLEVIAAHRHQELLREAEHDRLQRQARRPARRPLRAALAGGLYALAARVEGVPPRVVHAGAAGLARARG